MDPEYFFKSEEFRSLLYAAESVRSRLILV